jgi:hypothetical protein
MKKAVQKDGPVIGSTYGTHCQLVVLTLPHFGDELYRGGLRGRSLAMRALTGGGRLVSGWYLKHWHNGRRQRPLP